MFAKHPFSVYFCWPILVLGVLTPLLFLAPPAAAAPSATFVVDRTDDNAAATACTAAVNDCSLRGAIITANGTAGADVITLPAGTYTLSIVGTGENNSATGDLDIRDDLTIAGAGLTTTVINANGVDRVFQALPAVATTVTVQISGVTIRGGSLPAGITNMGGGFAQDSSTTGNVNLTLNNVLITANSTGNNGGAIGVVKNAGASNAVITLNNSTIAGNTALNGGGINCAGCTLNSNNSTISGNGASTSGGGINVTVDSSNVTLFNTTISGNTANGDGGGIAKTLGAGIVALNFTTITNNTADADVNGAGDGGGIRSNSNTTLQNSLVQGNTDATTPATGDCSGTITSNNFNVVGAGTGCPAGGANDSTAGASIGALQNNGGPTFTHLPAGGSSALDRVTNGLSGCSGGVSVDQRGAVRANGVNRGGSHCDSGAVEGDSSQTPTAVLFHAINSTTTNSYIAWVFGLWVLVVTTGWLLSRRFLSFSNKM